MVPSVWIPLREIPLTSSSKVDRRIIASTLEGMSRTHMKLFKLADSSHERKQPTTEVEKQLALAWASVLGLDPSEVGADDDFFALGGDSILATRIVASCRSPGLPTLSTAAILRHRTIASLAKLPLNGTTQGNALEDTKSSLLFTTPNPRMVQEAAKACETDAALVDNVYPATPMQKALFTIGSRDKRAYRGIFVYTLVPTVDQGKLCAAWNMLAAATPILRTRLILIAADIWQAVLRTESTQIRVESGSLEEYLARERDATMAMSFGAALFRATFLVDRKSRYLIFGSHHAVYDGWSLRTLMRELENAYIHNNMARPSYVISNNHLHFVRYVAQVDPKESRKFWSDYLAERPNVMFPQLKAALASRQPSTDTTVRQDIILPASSYSTSTLLYAAWAQLAAIHTNTADVLFGITNLGRDLPDFQHSWDIVGPLITTTPLRVKISPDVTTSDYLEAVSDAVQTTTPYQHFGLQSIRQASRDSGVACEFNSLLIVQYPEESDCLVVEKMDIGGDVHPYPLVLEATPLPKEGIIRINAHFDSVLLEKEMIISLIASLGHLLATLSHPKHASLKLEAIDMLPAADRSLIYTWNADSNLPSSVDLRIHDVIHDHAIRNPTDDAIVAWDGIFTYKELDHLSKCLADILLEAGVRRTELVPICLERSAWWAVAQLGVLKAGAACISLDPNYPAARNRKILTTSLAKVIIVSNDTRNLFEGSGLKLITLDEPSLKMRPEPFTWINAREEVISSDPAYVVFTSGSTGSPKGIAIEHVALCTSAVNYGKALSISQSSRVLQFASCTFDVSVGEVLTTLMHGGCVCIPSDEERLSELPNCVNRYQVNWLYLTSSIALLMKPRDLPSLKTLVVGGEAVHQSVIETWAESHVDLINAYGPAEASIYCAMRTVTSRTIDARDIGKAVGCRMWITQIDNPHRLVPIGVTGEILIEGPILAREYLYNPELTAEHFITTSWLPGRRLYRTGDLACYDFDGNMNFRGRLDSQGVRDVVREAAAVVVDWRHQQTEATAKLVAFVAFQDIPVEDTARRHVLRMTTISRSRFRSLKAHLEGLVPKHMLPSMYVPMRQLPKTTSLKLDRAALAALVSEFRQEELQEYSLRDTQEETNVVNGTKISHSAEEKVLLCLWSRLLSLDEGEIGKNESFFNMGGDSASAMQFVWEAKEQGWNLSLSDLYQKPTITLLARHIATRNAKSTLPQIPARFALLGDDEKEEIFDLLRTSRTIPTSEIEDIYPATDTQIALLSQTADRPGIWVAKDRWAFPVGFDVDRFRAALETLVDKTPILRTRIVQSSSGSRCYQVVLHHKSITSMWEDSTQAKDIGFNTSLSVYRILSPNDTQGLPELEWVRHHAIYDGWSTKLMFNFVSQYYRNGVILPSLQPYSCYVKLIQCLDKENARSTWKSVLRDIGEDALRGASFPLSLQHSSREQDQSSAEDSPVAASKLQRKLSITISPERGSLSAVLEAAWSLVLSAYADSQDIIFGVIQSGRTGASMEDVVGPTISFTPRRFKMNDSMSIGTFLENSYTDSASVVQYQHLGLGIIKDAFPHQSIRFENVLVMQGNGFGEKDSERHMQEMGLQQIFKDNQGDGEPFALVLECTPGKATCQGVLQIAARYDKRIIEHKTIERLLSYWESIANQLFTLPLQTRLSDVPLWNEGTLGNKQILPKPVETRIQDLVSRHWEYGSGHAAAPAIETTSGLAFTYREVRQQAARQCAELLRNGFDAQNGSFVLICSERSPWTVIAMFAVWLAGGAVVLLDPSLPLNRLHSIAQKVKANVVLSSTPAKRIWEQYPNSLTIIDIIPPSTGGDYEAKLATPPANSTTTAIHLEDETKVGIIKAHLKRYLPTTHIPVAWVAIGRFPLMPSGKVDRAWIQRQLEDMQHDSRPTPDATALSVVTVLENKVLDVIEQVLGNDAARKQSGSTFLELGGDSLMAMNIVARCRASNIHITLGLLLGGQSVRELVKSATQKSRETVSISRDAYEPNVKNLPLTLMQMKFFDFYPFGPNHFNQSMFVSIASPRTANVCCRKILHSLVKHHPALRTRFERREGNQKWFPQPIDQIANALSFREHSVDSETSPIIEREMVASHKSLNINTGPLFSARAFSIKNTGLRYLYLVAHHTIVDIVSWTILLNDIESLLGGQELPLDPITYVSEPPFENEDRHAVRPLHDKSATSRINDFWGVVDGPRTTATGTRRFNMRLEPEKTRILIDSVRKIEGLQVADVLEGAIACAFMRICEREGRHADLEMFIEEHGRHSSDGVANLAVGWFTKLRKVALPESPSSTPLVEMIWYAHDQRVRFREVNHANSFQLPIEFVFNYTGKARALTDDGLFRQVSPSTAALAKKVPDVDPHLTPMSLIELLVAHSDDSLNLQIQHDVRIQRTSLLHEFLGTFLVLLKDEIIPGLTSKDWQTRLRRLAVLDSGDYTTSQRLREELLSKLELEDLDAVEDVWMCTPWQNRIIFAQLQDPKLYHIHAAWKVSSPNILDAEKVDEEKLRAACDTVVQHHPALRVAFVQLTGMTSLTQVLLRHTGKTSPLRVVKEANDLIIELSISHTLFDAGSDAVLRRDIARCYSGQPLNHDSKGALQAYYAHLEKTDTKSADKYWTNHLEGIEPTRLPPLGSTDDSFGYVDSTLDHELTLAIRPWCQRMKASPAAAIHVAWAIALSTYTESEDVCFGWLTAGRDAPITGIDDAIGMFVKLLVARIKVDQSQGIGDIVATAAQGIASGLQHQAGNLTLYRHGQNLFDTLVSVQTEFEEQSTSLETSSSLKFDAHPSIDRTTFSLVLHASIAPESTEFRMTFNTSKISESMAHAFFDAFHQALNAVLTSSAGTPVSSIDLCVPSHQKLMCAFNPDPIFDTPSGSSLTITDFFLAQVHQRPHAVAIRGWDYEFSYSQVNLLSISFARHLQHLGICHGDAVPLLCDKSAMVPVVVLGILRLGGVCIFLSPTDGIHRLQSIVATASHGPTRVVVASLRHASKAHTLGCTTVVELEKESLREDSSSQVIEDQSHPNDVAFLVFTSGSTGVPKGIRIHHEALCLSITSASSRLLVTKDSRILQFSAYTFDVSIGDMLFAFFNGGVLCVPSEDERLNDLNGAMQKFHANWSAMTPSVAILLQPEACQSLQTLVLIGEMALSEIYATWSPRINLFNAWGPAECSVVSSAYKVRSATDYEGRIGTPLSCRLWLVNPQDPSRHVPVGCVGELLVEGPHVALGYMRDKRKTEEVFISPSKTPSWLTPSPKSKFYLTGDLARFTPDEGITFLGRKDSQIKMHGQRIELGEIEFHVRRKVAELTWMPFAAAVDLFRHPTGGDTLVAFLARRNGDSAKNGRVQAVRPERLGLTEAGGWENMLKRSLCVNLPVYMVPSEFILVDALPKSPSGKLDRKELRLFAAEWMKRRSTQIDSKSYELNPMESSSQKSLADRIRALWARVMKLDEASIALEDHFFRRGGDSILAMRLSAAALDDGLHLPTVAIIKNPVLSSMVDAVRMDSPRDSLMNRNPPVPLEPSSSASRNDTIGDHASEFPATDFQSSMILSNIAPGRGFLNYFVLRLQPSTTNSMLENAWNQVLFRHSILRACCIRKQQQILYKISQSASEEQIQVHTIEEDDDADQYTRVLINVDRAGPLRFGDCLAKLFLVGSSSKDCSRAIIRLSHAQYDGMCIQALWNDLSLACSGAQLKPAANSFAEFAHSVTGLNEAARSYWHSYLLGSQITPLSDTADSFGNMDGHIQSSFSAKLFSLRDMTPATALKGAWALVLSWYSGSRDVLFGHLVSCRETLPSGMHEAVGAFINCIPVRARLEADMHPQCLLKHIHQHHIDSLEHNWIGLQTLIKSCTEWPSTARFSSVVQYQNMLASLSSLQRIDTCGLNGTTIDVVARSGAYSDVWITATPSEDGKSVVVDCHFDKIVLDKCVAAKLLVGLKAALQFLHTDQPVLRFSQLICEAKPPVASDYQLSAPTYASMVAGSGHIGSLTFWGALKELVRCA
ncbi:hypothetical protein PTNB29_09376 [Pyrenophora teres f. teres]|nr:hypothetical protein PTNB29_09376 [Pyrenophora teres f. teres]